MTTDTDPAAGRYTVEGYRDGGWHPVFAAGDREAAIRGAGSAVVSGAFAYVRLMLGAAAGTPRELARIDRHGTVWNGAFVETIPAMAPISASAAPTPARSAAPRVPVLATVAAVAVFAVGIAVGRWAAQVI